MNYRKLGYYEQQINLLAGSQKTDENLKLIEEYRAKIAQETKDINS